MAQFRDVLWLDELKIDIRRVVTMRRPWLEIFADICPGGKVDLLSFALVLTMLHGCATDKLSRDEVERLFRQIQIADVSDGGCDGDANEDSTTINAQQLQRFVETRRGRRHRRQLGTASTYVRGIACTAGMAHQR